MNKVIAIFIIITFLLFALGAWTGKAANSEGDGSMGKALVALLMIAIPIVCWLVYGIIYFVKHIHFN